MSANVYNLKERKAVFRDLLDLNKEHNPEVSDGYSHSPTFILGVIERFASTGNVDQALRLLEQGHKLTSTRIGAVALNISESLYANKDLAKSFIDADVFDDKIAFQFDRNADGYERVIENVLKAFGSVELYARPGEEMFEGVESNGFIYMLDPLSEVVESVEIDEDEDGPEDEDDEEDVDLEDDDEFEDEEDDEDDDEEEEVEEDVEYLIDPFVVNEEAIPAALAEAELTDDDIDKLFEMCFFGPEEVDNELIEKKKKPPKMKLRARAKKAARGGGGSADMLRTRMLRAMAQKGFLVHGSYKKKGVPALIKKWQKFKKKGASASLRAMKKSGVSAEMIRSAKKAAAKAAKQEAVVMDALPWMTEDEQNLYLDTILESIDLLNEEDEEASYVVSPFELDDDFDDSEDFSDEEIDELYGIAFENDEDVDEEIAVVDEKAPKMKIKKRATIAGRARGVDAKTMRVRMLRAIAQKGFLNHGKYKKGGVPALINKWKKFKKKGAGAALRSLKKQGVGAKLMKAARKGISKAVKAAKKDVRAAHQFIKGD